MISPCDLHVRRMLRNLGRPLALLLCFDIIVVVAYVSFKQRWLALPSLPLSIGGGGLCVLLGFRNNISHARWWEARTLWGRIVNHSRCLGRQAVAYTSAGDQPRDRGLIRDTQRRILYYQIAYVNALRCQLRGQAPWPELEPFLPKEEIDSLRGEKNAAAEIQRRMALLIQESCHRGWLAAVPLALLDNGLTELANAQGGCERIKNTPMPRHYDSLIRFFIHLFCILLPLGMVASLGLLTPIGSALLGFGFLALESIGRDLDHPFANSVHDVPMTSLCRTIEINLKQYLGEADLPAPIEPVRGVLW
jgi:ion channel-forming bestrophin family protein